MRPLITGRKETLAVAEPFGKMRAVPSVFLIVPLTVAASYFNTLTPPTGATTVVAALSLYTA